VTLKNIPGEVPIKSHPKTITTTGEPPPPEKKTRGVGEEISKKMTGRGGGKRMAEGRRTAKLWKGGGLI